MSTSSTLSSINVGSSITAPISLNLAYPSGGQSTGYAQQISFPVFTVVGTTQGLVSKRYIAARVIPSSGSADSFQISTSGSLTDELGNPVTFANVGAVIVSNPSSTATLSFSAAGTNGVAWAQLAGTLVLTPGTTQPLFDAQSAMGVTASTADALKVAVNTGTNVAYDIVIVGR